MNKFEKAINEIKSLLKSTDDWSDDHDKIEEIVNLCGPSIDYSPLVATEVEIKEMADRIAKSIFFD